MLSNIPTAEYDYLISYKYANPHVIQNKTQIIPTASGFSNLKEFVHYDLQHPNELDNLPVHHYQRSSHH